MKSLFFGFVLALCFITCNQTETSNSKLLIATAANTQFVMQELGAVFTKKTAIDCELIIGSSGKLTAQIKAGAPYDLLISADMQYPSSLFDAGLALKAPRVYAFGQLVLWTCLEEVDPQLQNLTDPNIKYIATANPQIAPYGKAAKQVLERVDNYETIQEKLVFGESIAQTNQFISTRVAQLGFTAKSVVLAPHLSNKGQWQAIDTSLYSPIEQGVVLLKNSEKKGTIAQKFYTFLFSNEAKSILERYGYQVVFDNTSTSSN